MIASIAWFLPVSFQFLLDGSRARVARRLSIPCRLQHAPDPRWRNPVTSASTRQRMHAFVRCVSGRGTRRKLSRTAHSESPARGFDVRRARLQLLHAIDLPVHPFQSRGEYLLALPRMIGRTRKILSSRRTLAARFAPLCARQCAPFIVHLAKAPAQCLEVIKSSLIKFPDDDCAR
jgi:hypothetical protein